MPKKESKPEWRDRYLETVTVRAGDILPHALNPKIHPAQQLEPLGAILEDVGKVDALKAYKSEREGGALVYWDGHARMGLRPDEVWRVDVYDISDAEADLLLASFDPVGWEAEQSRAKLESLMQDIQTGNADLMSFLSKQAEEAGIIPGDGSGGTERDAEAQTDRAEELNTKWQVQPGDLWRVGSHRLLCGDSTKVEDVGRLLVGRKAVAVITDPPYNVGIDYGDSTDDEQAQAEYAAWSRRWFALAKNAVEFCVVLTTGIINLPMWIADIERTHRILSWVKQNQCSRNYIGATSGFNCWEPVLVYGKSKKCVARDCFDIPIHIQADADGHPCPKS